jgi:acetyl-CoA carboxylase biotin carboxyl carrier protein
MNVDKIKELIDLMNANNLSELEIDEDGVRVRLQKGLPKTNGVVVTTASVPAAKPAEEPAAPEAAEEPAPGTDVIKAPMVGTFYRAPGPDEPAFVEVGDKVTPDSVVCIIEAMKVMNEIKADAEGVIAEVLVENGSPIEFGQPLFRIATP